jgi:hypothetical protein
MSSENRKVVARNRKATFDYHLLETFEAGIALAGVEIKSIRANQINLQDGWAVPKWRLRWQKVSSNTIKDRILRNAIATWKSAVRCAITVMTKP